ncbi:MAG TPA: phosphatase PAP2 family protein [Mycobacteriales bacterium]|nr:phosphatase PAP2 family protein [Mycobacteriales bacterium]
MSADRMDLAASVAGTPTQREREGLVVGVDQGPLAQQQVSWYAWLKAHRKTWTAIRGFREVVLIAAVYSLYDMTRFLVEGKTSVAMAHGRDLLRLEQRLGVAPEHALNKLFTAHLSLGLSADYIYATLHYIVTPVVLVWMWRRHGSAYASARTVLMVATILALVGYSLFPVAPPRLLPGFFDTMAKFSHYGWWSTAASAPRGLGGDTNQFAAMPSLHVGWAIWCGWMLVRYGRHRVTKIFGVLYPLVLSLDVMVTANHYLLDVLAGGVVMGLAYLAVRLLSRAGMVSFPSPEGSQDAPPGPQPSPG